MEPKLNKPSLTVTLLLSVVVACSFVSNSLGLPITEQGNGELSSPSDPALSSSQVEIIHQDPLPSTEAEDLTKSIDNANSMSPAGISNNFPQVVLAPGGLLPTLMIEDTILPQVKSSTIDADSVQIQKASYDDFTEVLRRVIPLLPSSITEDGDARPLTREEIEEVVGTLPGVALTAEEISPEVSSSEDIKEEIVDSKEASAAVVVDKESLNALETLEDKQNNNLPAKTEDETVSSTSEQQITIDQQANHSNDTKTIITPILTAINTAINQAITAANDIKTVIAGNTLAVPQPFFSAVNPIRNGSVTDSEEDVVKEIEPETQTADNTKSVELSSSTSSDSKAALVAADDKIPSEDEVDDVRTPESSLVLNTPEVNEKAAAELLPPSTLEESIALAEYEVPVDIFASAIPLIPNYLNIERQRIYADDGSAFDMDPMSLVIPILPSAPVSGSKAVRTGQIMESEGDLYSSSSTGSSSSQDSSLRLSNPIPLLASSPLFREPLAVLSQQVERFRPFMKYVSSHVPSFSVDPFNINRAEDYNGGINAEEEDVEDDLSAFFYLQDPANQVIPLLRKRNQIKKNEEATPEAVVAQPQALSNLDEVSTVNQDSSNSEESSPLVKEDTNDSKTEVNSKEPVISAGNVAETTQEVVATEDNNSSGVIASHDQVQSVANNDDRIPTNEQKEPEGTNSQVAPSSPSDADSSATNSDSSSLTSPATSTATTTNNNARPNSNNNKPLSSSSSSRPNSNNNVNKPPRPAFGIQSPSSSSNNPTSAAAAATPPSNPPRPFSIPGILLNPIEALGWHIPAFQWPSFSQMLRRLFGRHDPNNINNRNRNAVETTSMNDGAYENLRFGIDSEDYCGGESGEVETLKSSSSTEESNNDNDSKSMCQTELPQGLASSACNKFCNQHGFTSGTCFNGENCVCDMVREDGTFGLTFKRLADYGDISRMESLDLDHEDVADNDQQWSQPESTMQCQRCACSSDCKKSGAYIGLCGNTCYCGLPWQTGSLTL